MINHILLICSSVIIYEFLKYLKFNSIIILNLKIYLKILKLIKYKNVSDFRKEKLLFNYSKSLFAISIKILLILILILIFIYTQGLIFEPFLSLVLSIFGIIEIAVFFTIYHNLRKIINAKL